MKTAAGLLIAGVLFLLAGCIPSLHPLYTKNDLVFDRALLGAWSSKKDGKWVFGYGAEKQVYKAVYTDANGKRGEFVAHLLKIKGAMFLDLYPADPKLTQNDYYKTHLVPAHTFLLVAQMEPSLKFHTLDGQWLQSHLQRHPGALPHEIIDDNQIVLTASTEQLQKFVLKHLQTKNAFGEATEWVRK